MGVGAQRTTLPTPRRGGRPDGKSGRPIGGRRSATADAPSTSPRRKAWRKIRSPNRWVSGRNGQRPQHLAEAEGLTENQVAQSVGVGAQRPTLPAPRRGRRPDGQYDSKNHHENHPTRWGGIQKVLPDEGERIPFRPAGLFFEATPRAASLARPVRPAFRESQPRWRPVRHSSVCPWADRSTYRTRA